MKRLGYFLLGVISGFLSVAIIIRKIWKIISRSPLIFGEFARAFKEIIYALLFGEKYHPRYAYRGPITYYKPYKKREILEAVFKTKREAEEVIEKLKDAYKEYNHITIYDFYKASGNINTPDPEDFDKGWYLEDLESIEIRRPEKKNGIWTLQMPEWRYLK